MYDYGSVAMAGDKIITKRHSISAADEIYTSLLPTDKWRNSHTRMTTSLNN